MNLGTPVRYHPVLSDPFREPALRFCVLASGSKGNAVFVGGRDGWGVLVDAGLPGAELERRLVASGLDPARVAAVVVTHEHRDHVAGVGVWARRFGVPVYVTAACRRRIEDRGVLGPRGLRGVTIQEFGVETAFTAGGVEFLPFATSHDAAESVGFRATDGRSLVTMATDLGVESTAVRDGLAGADLLFLESNHDPDLLVNGPYPRHLKRRIRSRRGHLSNDDACTLLAGLLHPGLRAVVLGHLSETNNTPRRAYDSARGVLAARAAAGEVTLLVARQDRPGRVLSL